MKNLLMLVSFFAFFLRTYSATQDIQYLLARPPHLDLITQLLSTKSTQDSNRIVAPSRQSIQKSIALRRLFIAQHNHQVVSLAKCFIAQGQERDDILIQELRCLNQDLSFCMPCGYKEPGCLLGIPPREQTCYLYLGTQFTHPAYRSQGVASCLLAKALHDTLSQKTPARYIALMYGLTEENAGYDFIGGRTRGILDQFQQALNTREMQGVRFPAIKPTFDEETGELIPEKGVPGYGYVLYHDTSGDQA